MKKSLIRKRYQELISKIKSGEYYGNIDLVNRVNCYVCPSCNHITKTKDIDKGTTPFMHFCERCGELARSTFYRDILPVKQAVHAWYRPSLNETVKLKGADLDHVLKGGLFCRKIEQG